MQRGFARQHRPVPMHIGIRTQLVQLDAGLEQFLARIDIARKRREHVMRGRGIG